MPVVFVSQTDCCGFLHHVKRAQASMHSPPKCTRHRLLPFTRWGHTDLQLEVQPMCSVCMQTVYTGWWEEVADKWWDTLLSLADSFPPWVPLCLILQGACQHRDSVDTDEARLCAPSTHWNSVLMGRAFQQLYLIHFWLELGINFPSSRKRFISSRKWIPGRY